MHHFLNHYNQVVLPKLQETKSYTSRFEVPKVSKVTVNVGVGDLATDSKAIDALSEQISQITGQKPVVTKARKAIAGFKIRQNMPVGLKVTLRGPRMYDFLTKLIQVGLPRTRDFRGLKLSGVTSDGNLNIGIKDSAIFPELSQTGTAHGIQVTLVSNATNLEEAQLLYRSLGFVFQEPETAA